MQEYTLVTGGAGGIGTALVARLEQDGQRVIVVDRTEPPSAPGRVFARIDLADVAAAPAALARLCAEHRVTRLVNNAAIAEIRPVDQETPATLRRAVASNLQGPLLCTQAVLPGMKERRFGRIVNLGSRGAFGKENRFAYNATKGGIHTVTRSWALELAPFGITVNAVGPGVTDTPMYRRNNPPDAPQTMRTNGAIPMGRIAQPEEVADAVAFFLGERAGYVTGQLLFVCGGLSLGTNPSA